MSLKDITLGRYVYGTSLLHRLDPRTKLVCLLAVMLGIFAPAGRYSLVIGVLYVIVAAAISRLNLMFLVRSILPFKWLILITILLNVIFKGGHIIIEAPLPYGGITHEGLTIGLTHGFRIALLVFGASLMSLTTEPVALVGAIEKLLQPFRRFGLHPHVIALSMVITIRFIPVLLDEAIKIRKAHIALGLRHDSNITANLKSVSMLLIPLFVSAVQRAEHLATAMECRQYRNDVTRTKYRDSTMLQRDWYAIAITLIMVPVMLCL